MEVSPYIHPPFKIAMSWSNGLRMKNVVELHATDVSWSPRVFAMELRCEFWCGDFGSGERGKRDFDCDKCGGSLWATCRMLIVLPFLISFP